MSYAGSNERIQEIFQGERFPVFVIVSEKSSFRPPFPPGKTMNIGSNVSSFQGDCKIATGYVFEKIKMLSLKRMNDSFPKF